MLGFAARPLLVLAAALSMGQSSATVPAHLNGSRSKSPTLGNAINTVSSGGGAGRINQTKRRRLRWSNVGRKHGVKCQGRRSGSGRRSR